MFDVSRLKVHLQAYDSNTLIGEKDATKAAVLIPLIETDDGWSLLFEERSHLLKSQPGDICFPGGKVEAQDRSPEETAIRETCEELGINSADINILGSLGRYVPSSRLVVYPFIGILNSGNFSINKAEVEDIFQVPLDHLLQTKPEKHIVSLQPRPGHGFPYERIAKGENYQWRKRHITELFYHYQHRSIWGMTAKILEHFLYVLSS